MECPADTDDAHASEPMDVERNFGAARDKIAERKPHCFPTRSSFERLTIGLPRTVEIGRAQIERVFLGIPEDIQFNAAPRACVNGAAVRSEIESDLNKAAVVFEADVPTQSNGGSSFYGLANHGRPGYAAHDCVGKYRPPGSDGRYRRFSCEIVDDFRSNGQLALTSHRTAEESAGKRGKESAARCDHGGELKLSGAKRKPRLLISAWV